MLSGIHVLRAAATAAMALCASAAFAQASIVSGPSSDPTCMVPWKTDTKFIKYPKKSGPYRIALVNGYIANTWRIQMIKTAKAYTAQPAVAAKLKEFKVVSTGEDVPAQISAVNNFIDAGYDAIIVDAQNPASFGPAIRRAKKAGVVLVAFDNTLDSEDAINVDVDQYGLGVLWAKWLASHLPSGGKVLEVRGVAGTSVDTDRHNGFTKTSTRPARSGTSCRSMASGTTRSRRRPPPTRLPCRATSTAFRRKAATRASCAR